MRLREYLQERDIEVPVFARILGVDASSVYRYLAGRVPSHDIIRRIEKTTNGAVTPNDFFCCAAE